MIIMPVLWLFPLCLALQVSSTPSVQLRPALTAPSSSSQPLTKNFVSFSIAIHWFQDYTRTEGGTPSSHANVFSRNLLASLSESTGLAPYIRIGGTSADRTTYVTSAFQNTTISSVEGDNGIPTNVTLTRAWFDACFDPDNFPDGTKFIFDLPLLRNDSLALNNTLRAAAWAVNAIGVGKGGRLEALEIGNEEDLYAGSGVVPPNWGVQDYVARWKVFSEAVWGQVLRPALGGDKDKRWFQGLAFAGLGNNPAWTTKTAFDANVDEFGSLKTVSLHNYPEGNPPTLSLGNDFMNHTAVVTTLSQVIDDIDFLSSSPATRGIDFVLGETNSDFVNLNMNQFEGVLGSALWTIDYILYAASLNVKRMYLHQGTTFGYAAWQPVPILFPNSTQVQQEPQVRAPWYGLKFAAEAIGDAKGPVRIVPLDIGASITGGHASDSNSSNSARISNGEVAEKLSGYAIYDSDVLARIALINFFQWNGTAVEGPRPNVALKISLPRSGHGNANTSVSAPASSSSASNSASSSRSASLTSFVASSAASFSASLAASASSFISSESPSPSPSLLHKATDTSSTHSVTARRLTSPIGANAAHDITFGGVEWSFASQGMPVRVQGVQGLEQVSVNAAGRHGEEWELVVELGASEAMLFDVGGVAGR